MKKTKLEDSVLIAVQLRDSDAIVSELLERSKYNPATGEVDRTYQSVETRQLSEHEVHRYLAVRRRLLRDHGIEIGVEWS